MPQYDFSEKVAFVTGAARGQGQSHSVGYAKHGADVVVTDVQDVSETVSNVEEQGQDALALELDVSDSSSVRAAVEAAVSEFGHIDILANNAGIASVSETVDMDEEMWDATIDVNLKGVWLCAKHVGKHMIDNGIEGKIVSTSSTQGLVGSPGWAHYAAAKHGVIGVTKTLAIEYGDYGINVNAVCPTSVKTPIIGELVEQTSAEELSRMSQIGGPMSLLDKEGQMIEPEDVTEAFLWLSSEGADQVTGTALKVDAGFTAK